VDVYLSITHTGHIRSGKCKALLFSVCPTAYFQTHSPGDSTRHGHRTLWTNTTAKLFSC